VAYLASAPKSRASCDAFFSALEDVQREIDGLRLKRRESEVALESIIAALHNTLEYVREQDQREARIIPHRPLLNVAQSA